MNIAITGGGTGGHLSVAKALALECKNRGFRVIYIGSTNGQDKLWFENCNIFSKSYFLKTTGVVNKKGFGKFKALALQFSAVMKCRKILKQNNIQSIISVGGYSAGGGAMASIICKIPLFIHEQNARLGNLNKILSPFATNIFSSFKINSKYFIQTSYPINNEFFKLQRKRQNLESILFIGGSQGAMAINDFALNIVNDLLNRNIKIIHQCGVNDFEQVRDKYKKLGVLDKIDLFAFEPNLINKIIKADFCISRAGASSLWELCANGLPTYFIPYPFAAKNHQYYNALFLKDKGLCEVVEQKNLNKENFFKYLDSVQLEQVSLKLMQEINNDGSKEIVDRITKFLENRK
ncbi:MAG: undecaprenyldiphospho-muramoylpentapeptide beta-N-acetylglucosaminyltransferase [Helicobacteraceae bacterium]|nr:undecaprenyldiphospho-muramoylpentapeptide beta-N-acetylglucosaminyltransferase [Helicobacteraceae bacterium]